MTSGEKNETDRTLQECKQMRQGNYHQVMSGISYTISESCSLFYLIITVSASLQGVFLCALLLWRRTELLQLAQYLKSNGSCSFSSRQVSGIRQEENSDPGMVCPHGNIHAVLVECNFLPPIVIMRLRLVPEQVSRILVCQSRCLQSESAREPKLT